MKRPNFFILGAPKCGTTSLAAWLSAHPQVFMSEPKELDFFDRDLAQAYEDDLPTYEHYFADADDRYRAVGEASTGYLRSGVAVAAIRRYAPEARFIVCLRDPVELAQSWHTHLLTRAWETERNFLTAWSLQPIRRAGQQVPSLCPDPAHLQYAEVSALGDQIERLYEQVPRERVFCVLLDDLREDPRAVWRRLQQFLGLDDDGRREFPVLNEARRVPRWLASTTQRVYETKRRLGFSRGLGLATALNRLLARQPARPGPGAREQVVDTLLAAGMDAQTRKLERLLGRDLSAWHRHAQQSRAGTS